MRLFVTTLAACSFAVMTGCGTESESESPSTDPIGQPASAVPGDGLCTGSEDAHNTPEDCLPVAGDGWCTHNENAQSTPQDCPTTAGDGVCTGNETAQNTPEDCSAQAGDGLCTGNENALNTPQDCPTRAGDGLCTGNENAQNTPQDCPTVAGDGLCTGNEDPQNTPQDCPAPDVIFNGGTLAALAAYSPTLYFGDLTISGTLRLDAHDNETLHAESFTITPSGKIEFVWDTCEYSDGPDLSIVAEGLVDISGRIILRGRSGTGVTSSATCNACFGTDAGSVTIVADMIIASAGIDVAGGRGSQLTDVVGGQTLRMGCDGGDGGAIVLSATTAIELSMGAHIGVEGGEGGISSVGLSPGTPGANGTLSWHAPTVHVAEQSSNGTMGGAQPLSFSPLEVDGYVSVTDDSDSAYASDSIYIIADGAPNDRIEDMFRVFHAGTASRTFTITLTATYHAADLDVYVLSKDGAHVLAGNNGPGPHEQTTFSASPGGEYIIGVSAFVGSSGSSYTLLIQ